MDVDTLPAYTSSTVSCVCQKYINIYSTFDHQNTVNYLCAYYKLPA